MRAVRRFLASEDGPTAVEYCFLLALILMGCMMGVAIFGQQTYESLNQSSETIEKVLRGGGS